MLADLEEDIAKDKANKVEEAIIENKLEIFHQIKIFCAKGLK